MPKTPPSPCTFPGCSKLVRGRGSRCPEHSYEAARPNAHRRAYSGRRWRLIRDIVIERDGGTCQECGGFGRQVAHIRDRRLGGSDDPANLRLLCDSCHSRETARQTKFGRPDSERFIRLFRAASERVKQRRNCEGGCPPRHRFTGKFSRSSRIFSRGSGEGPAGSGEGGEE